MSSLRLKYNQLARVKKPDSDRMTSSAPSANDGKIASEAYDGGAPSTGNSNYAQNLPSAVDTAKARVKRAVKKSDVASTADSVAEAVVKSINDLDPIFEAFIAEQSPCWKGYQQSGMKKKNGKKVPNCIPEELKVGDDDQEQKKVRGSNTVKGKVPTLRRKYLGNSRGTTATGKRAHAIDVQPVIGQSDKNVNKTTPSGPRKK